MAPAALRFRRLAFSPDGKTLAVGGYQEVLLWDLAEGKLSKRIAVPQSGEVVRGGLPPGRTVAGRSRGRGLRPGSGRAARRCSGQQAAVFQEPKDVVLTVAFSPDGKLLAAAGADITARVWSVDEKKLLASSRAIRRG